MSYEVYLRTGPSPEERSHFYCEIFKCAIPDEGIHNIRQSVNRNYPTGHDRFKHQRESTLRRKLGTAARGRPRTNRSKNNRYDPLTQKRDKSESKRTE